MPLARPNFDMEPMNRADAGPWCKIGQPLLGFGAFPRSVSKGRATQGGHSRKEDGENKTVSNKMRVLLSALGWCLLFVPNRETALRVQPGRDTRMPGRV